MALIEAFLIFSVLFILSTAIIVVVSKAVHGLFRLVVDNAGRAGVDARKRSFSATPVVGSRRAPSNAWKPVAYNRSTSGFRPAH